MSAAQHATHRQTDEHII